MSGKKQYIKALVICSYCGSDKLVYPKELIRYRSFFCNRLCKGNFAKSQVGDKAPNWRGGKTYTIPGYIQTYKPDHPFASSKGYVYEHRVIMENKLGRILKNSEVVHHINHDKTDNRIDNLLLTDRIEHMRVYHPNNIIKAYTAKYY